MRRDETADDRRPVERARGSNRALFSGLPGRKGGRTFRVLDLDKAIPRVYTKTIEKAVEKVIEKAFENVVCYSGQTIEGGTYGVPGDPRLRRG